MNGKTLVVRVGVRGIRAVEVEDLLSGAEEIERVAKERAREWWVVATDDARVATAVVAQWPRETTVRVLAHFADGQLYRVADMSDLVGKGAR